MWKLKKLKWLKQPEVLSLIIASILFLIQDPKISPFKHYIYSLSFILLTGYLFSRSYDEISSGRYIGFSKFCFYILILTLSIILMFSSLYKNNSDVGIGVFTLEDKIVSVGPLEVVYFSTHIFFSTGYQELTPQGLSKFFVILEVACNYFLFILFISFAASHPNLFFKETKIRDNKKSKEIINGGNNE